MKFTISYLLHVKNPDFKRNEVSVKVAVKVHKGRSSDRETVEQICREARIIRRLEHPNVIRLYGIALSKVCDSHQISTKYIISK